jgi:hypothetical protein
MGENDQEPERVIGDFPHWTPPRAPLAPPIVITLLPTAIQLISPRAHDSTDGGSRARDFAQAVRAACPRCALDALVPRYGCADHTQMSSFWQPPGSHVPISIAQPRMGTTR